MAEEANSQKDNANKQNTPNKSPEKPSETPAAPKGPGTDTQGDESTPNENQPNGKASKLDLKEYEKDNIDALLDAIENGNFYVPLSGNKKNTQISLGNIDKKPMFCYPKIRNFIRRNPL